MSVIHFSKKYFFNKVVLLGIVIGLLIFNVSLCIGAFASYGGGSGMGGVGYNTGPGYEFDGLYTISQNYSELTPGDDGVYVISDYESAPRMWIDRAKVNSGNAFYVTQTRKVYDENDTEIQELTVGTGHTSNYASPYNIFETSTLKMEYVGKYTEFNTVLSDVDYTGSGPGENVFATITVRLAYADYDPDAIPSVTVTDVRQAGEHLPAEYGYGEWRVKYNNKMDVEVDYRAENLLPGMSLRLYNAGRQVVLDSTQSTRTVKYRAGYYPQKFSTNFAAFGSIAHVYQDHSDIGFSTINDNSTPYFDMYMIDMDTGERIGPDGSSYTMSYEDSYADKNLGVKIEGYNYQQETEYDINTSFFGPVGEPSVKTISKTGAELNSGVVVPYDQVVRPITIQDLLTSSLNGTDYGITCTVGYSTRAIDIWYYYSKAQGVVDMFNSAGESFLQHYRSGASGDAGILNGTATTVIVEPSLVTDHLYFGMDVNGEENVDYEYYLFRSDSLENDFYQKTLLDTGSIAAKTPLYIDVGEFPGNGTTYSVVFVRDGVVEYVNHFQVQVMGDDFHRAIEPLIFSVSADNTPVYMRNSTNFTTNFNTPVDVKVLMQTAKADETYQIKIQEGSGNYEYSGEVSGAELNGSTTLLSIPAQSSDYVSTSKNYYFSVSQNGRLLAESDLSIIYTDSDDYLGWDYIYTDLLNNAYDQIVENQASEGSFAATLTAPETFENEFDAYLAVGEYEHIVGNCGGICGVVGELDYDYDQLELVSVEPLAGFEMEQGDRIVLYRPTGVEDGTAIMKLRFRKLNMTVGTSATVTFRNIEGSNGVANIATSETSVSTRYDIPFRFVESHVFSHEEYEINPAAGSGGDGLVSGLTRPVLGSQIGEGGITIFYKGYGFDENATYTYALVNTTTQQNVSTGEIAGAELRQGAFSVRHVPFSAFSDSDYELRIYDNDALIYTHTDSFRVETTPVLYVNFGYGYNKAGIVNGQYTVPYNSDIAATVTTNGLDDATTYKVEYGITNYSECREGSSAERYSLTCTEDAAAPELSGAVFATGAEIKAGVDIALPAAQVTTIRRQVVFSVKTSGGLTSQTLRNSTAYVNLADTSDMVKSVRGHAVDNNLIFSKVNPSTTVESALDDFELTDGYSLAAVSKDGNVLGQDAFIGTGSKIVVRDNYGQTILEYTVKIKGDTSGDGKITVLDLVQAKRHLAGVSRLEGIFAEAGDITNSRYIGITDVVKICRQVAGIEEVKQ